jgi:hypothetical protein
MTHMTHMTHFPNITLEYFQSVNWGMCVMVRHGGR